MYVWKLETISIIINNTVFKSSNVLNMNMKEKEVQKDGYDQVDE